MEILTQAKILTRTKLNALHEVRNLNLWGQDYSDISVIRECTNLEVLSLSVNSITTLADLRSLYSLKELYLRKNLIRDLNEILYLQALPQLRILWLSENPCCAHPHYREYVLSALPQLDKLDNIDVTVEERNHVETMKRSGKISVQHRTSDNGEHSPGLPGPFPRGTRHNKNNLSADIGESEFLTPSAAARAASSFHRGGGGGEVQRQDYTTSRRGDSAASSYRRDAASAANNKYRINVLDEQGEPSSNDFTSTRTRSPVRHSSRNSAAAPRTEAFTSSSAFSSSLDLSSAEREAQRRTEQLEEEIRQLRVAEEREKAREAAKRYRVGKAREVQQQQDSVLEPPPAHSSAPTSPHSSRPSSSSGIPTDRSSHNNPLRSSLHYQPVAAGLSTAASRPQSSRAHVNPASNIDHLQSPALRLSLEMASARGGSSSRPQTAHASTSPRSPRSPRASYVNGSLATAVSVATQSVMTPRTHSSFTSTSSLLSDQHTSITQHNLMCAALAMLEEFDLSHLLWLQKATERKIDARKATEK